MTFAQSPAKSPTLCPHPEAERLEELIAKARNKYPDKRPRDLAHHLGLPEGLMLSARCGADVTRLQPATKRMIKAFETLGEVMVLTRNEFCVHEKVGTYGRVGGGGKGNFVFALNGDVDLRIFMPHWLHIFAVVEESKKGTKRSIQIFNAAGDAVHKIHLRETSDIAAFDALVLSYRHEDQTPFFLPQPAEAAEQPRVRCDEEVDVEALRADWLQMTDVHQFFGILEKHKVSRRQAHRLVGRDLACPLDTGAVRAALTAAAEMKLPIMVFVRSPGCVQIHSGPIETLKIVGSWFNILDPRFNLHLHEDQIHSVWLVRKPNAFGHVSAIEVYDEADDMIVQLYGVREEDCDENPDWRGLVNQLPAIGNFIEGV